MAGPCPQRARHSIYCIAGGRVARRGMRRGCLGNSRTPAARRPANVGDDFSSRSPSRRRLAVRVKASGALAQALRDAAPIVAAVAEGKSLAALLEAAAVDGLATQRAALIDLTHGTLRRYGRVQAIVELLSRRGAPAQPVEALLWCSIYALESSRYADYTVVDQAVRACGLLEQWNAKGYVNALLRAYLRERT